MTPTLLYQRFGNLVLAVQSALSPSETDWAGYVKLYRHISHSYDRVRILVASAGGAPSNLQQRRVNELVPGMSVRVAVLAMAPSVAKQVSRLIIVNDDMRMFPADSLERALDFLEVTDPERDQVRTALAAMQTRITDQPPGPSDADRG